MSRWEGGGNYWEMRWGDRHERNTGGADFIRDFVVLIHLRLWAHDLLRFWLRLATPGAGAGVSLERGAEAGAALPVLGELCRGWGWNMPSHQAGLCGRNPSRARIKQ